MKKMRKVETEPIIIIIDNAYRIVSIAFTVNVSLSAVKLILFYLISCTDIQSELFTRMKV